MTTRECVHIVTGSYFRSRNKDNGHTTRSAVAENPMQYAHFTALCVINAELLAMEFSHCGHPDLFWHADWLWENTGWLLLWPVILDGCCCDLDIDPMTFIYDLDPYSLEIQRMCKYELPTSRVSKVIVWQTDRQTESTRIIIHAASRVASVTSLVAHRLLVRSRHVALLFIV